MLRDKVPVDCWMDVLGWPCTWRLDFDLRFRSGTTADTVVPVFDTPGQKDKVHNISITYFLTVAKKLQHINIFPPIAKMVLTWKIWSIWKCESFTMLDLKEAMDSFTFWSKGQLLFEFIRFIKSLLILILNHLLADAWQLIDK